jgi:hypothetical protein
MRAEVRVRARITDRSQNSRAAPQKNVNGKNTARANIAASTQVSPTRKHAHT